MYGIAMSTKKNIDTPTDKSSKPADTKAPKTSKMPKASKEVTPKGTKGTKEVTPKGTKEVTPKPPKETKVKDPKTMVKEIVSSTVSEVVDNVIVDDKTDASIDDTESPYLAISSDFTTILTSLQALTQQASALKAAIRGLEKKAVRELKIANKASKKSKRAKGNRKPSGFVKPTKISQELATFLDKPPGMEMARTEVTKEINAYIRTNSLQNPTNGRIILADKKLRDLLQLKEEDHLTYFNLQKFMSPHFAKAVKAQPDAVSVMEFPASTVSA